MLVYIACLLAAAALASAQYELAPNVSTNLGTYGNSGYMYQPSLANATQTTTTLGAQTQPRDATAFPVLEGANIAQNSFVLAPCALRTPHAHPNANGLLYVVSADSLSVGFITTDGRLVNNTISSGATTLFPQGLLHWQLNSGCTDATYTISYSTSDPGTQNIVSVLMAVPDDVLATALGTDTNSISGLRSSVPKGSYVQRDAVCMARCGASVSGNLTSTLPSAGSSTAGRR